MPPPPPQMGRSGFNGKASSSSSERFGSGSDASDKMAAHFDPITQRPCHTPCPAVWSCSASLPLRWVSAETACGTGTISEAVYRFHTHIAPMSRDGNNEPTTPQPTELFISSRTWFFTNLNRVLLSLASSDQQATIFMNPTRLQATLLRRLLPLPQSVMLEGICS